MTQQIMTDYDSIFHKLNTNVQNDTYNDFSQIKQIVSTLKKNIINEYLSYDKSHYIYKLGKFVSELPGLNMNPQTYKTLMLHYGDTDRMDKGIILMYTVDIGFNNYFDKNSLIVRFIKKKIVWPIKHLLITHPYCTYEATNYSLKNIIQHAINNFRDPVTLEIIPSLIKHGYNGNYTEHDIYLGTNYGPIEYSIICDNYQALLLFEQMENMYNTFINSVTNDKLNDYLLETCSSYSRYHDANILKKLLEYKADVNYVCPYGNSMLLNACIDKFDHDDIINSLVKFGADIYKQNNMDTNPLNEVILNQPQLCNILLQNTDTLSNEHIGSIFGKFKSNVNVHSRKYKKRIFNIGYILNKYLEDKSNTHNILTTYCYHINNKLKKKIYDDIQLSKKIYTGIFKSLYGNKYMTAKIRMINYDKINKCNTLIIIINLYRKKQNYNMVLIVRLLLEHYSCLFY